MSLPVPFPVRCSEIWGGNGNTDLDVCTNGINASVYSLACGGERGGDVYYLSVCTHDMMTRMVVADVRGHGAQVSQLSAWLHEEIQARGDILVRSSGVQVLVDGSVANLIRRRETLKDLFAPEIL